MKIKLDDTYTLNSDQYCYWITEKRIVEDDDAKHKGEEYENRVSGYCATLEQVAESFANRKVRSSEAQRLTHLIKEIKSLKKVVKKWTTDNSYLETEKK